MQKKVSHYLKELILKNDCVILPDFGGFETIFHPAFFDSNTNEYYPPHKKVIFKEEFKKDNGYLANLISEKESISIDEAYSEIKKFVDEIYNNLNTSGEFTIEGIGKFIKTNEKIIFVPLENETFWIESFNLSKIKISEEHTKNIPDNHIKENFQDEKTTKRKTAKSYFAIIFILFVILAIIISSILIFKNITNQFKSREIILGQKKQFENNHLTENQVKNTTEFNTSSNNNETYTVVSGSFHYKNYAEDLYNELLINKLNPKILLTDNQIYRVVLGNFSSKDSAINYLNTLQKSYNYDFWIYSVTSNDKYIK